MAILGLIGSLFHLIPGFTSLASSIVNKVYDSRVAITTARIGGDTAVAQALVQATAKESFSGVDRLKAFTSSKVLLFIVAGFAAPFIFYMNKVIIWDICLGWGATPSIKDPQIIAWGRIIITGIFGSSTALAIGHLYFNRKD